MLKKVVGHSVLYAIGPQLPKVIGFALLPFLTPYLTDVDFGVWGTIMAFSLLFSSARDMGLTVPLMNSFYKNKSSWKWTWRQILWYLLLWGCILAILQSIVLWFVFPNEGLENKATVVGLLAIQMVVFDVPGLMAVRYCQVIEKPIVITWVSLIGGITAGCVHYVSVVYFDQGYMGWFYSTFISMGLTSLFYSGYLWSKGLTPLPVLRYRLAKPRFKVGLPMLPHGYSSYMLNASDRVMMTVLNVPMNSIGIYNAAYVWGNYIDMLGNAIGMAIGPTYLRLFSNNSANSLIKELTRFLQLGFILGSFVLALWLKELFAIFMKSDGLETAYSLGVIVIMSYSYRPLYWAIVSKIQFEEKTNLLWRISFTAGVLNIVLNLIFIPLYGYQMAAYTTFASLIYLGFIGHIMMPKMIGFKMFELFFWLCLICVTTALCYVLKDVSVYFKIIITVLSTFLFYIVSRGKIRLLNSEIS
jgi:O-antigen/teichoic acid export membrane protein